MIKGIIFDIDGILVDSEPLHAASIVEAMRIVSGKPIEFQPQKLIGLSLAETLDRVGIPKDCICELKKTMMYYYLEHLNKTMIRCGIQKLWQKLVRQDIPFGCVSSSEMKICKANIDLIELPSVKEIQIISCECLPQTKPHPLPYITMLERLGLSADEAVVLEDSDVGITSAKGAGIENIYAWPHGLSKDQSYKDAGKVIQDITEVPFIREVLLGDGKVK
ncbi:HAD superfamily hydrolase (TIGR01509 family) [Ruminiclostridium sufflavum DSM 19573]|uniref:HAD superfamily hydrolase (TIGR01509 family) n=1 Tax=Ruminiclostridium sufflavum DSM 19573 TaxID=1121337 RepID=A0A318XMV6_9FIRM|nr:HAD family phosphatase [Ruminiclostridium sufflavum]PYG87953.1 HAD superfamily hydrolase (TIGR01509 family) [Ruminiclostridium sufflavum DSM 19573]